MENRKDKNKLIYFLTIVVVIIVYLIIHIYGHVVREDIYLEKKGYENNVNVPPINSIISIAKDENINSLSFARENVSIKIGNTMKLIVTVDPASLASTKFIWESSDPSVVSVDENGNIKGLKEGTAIITVTSPDGKTASVKITVVKDEVKTKKIIVNPKSLSLNVGSVKQIKASVEPDNATNGDLKWKSSNPKVATVDENGVISGISPGTAIITVKTKDGTVTTQISVTVKDIVGVEVGGEKQINPNTINKPAGVTNKDLVWESSNPNVATVDQNGVVTGVNPGKTIITVKTKDGEILDQFTVVVKDKVAVEIGGTKPIDPNTIKKPDNVTNKDLVWESSNPNVATVDKNGAVTGVNPGTTIITVKTKDGKILDQVTVIVKDIVAVDVGGEKPIDPNTINKPTGVTNDDLVWESSNPSVATVDQNGVVTGVSPGKTVVTVKTKDGKIIDQVTIVVKDKVAVDVGGEKPIDPNTIKKPANVTNDDLVWESSNPNIATVDKDGVVTGVSPGKTVVTVKTKDGKILDQVTVIVKDKITVEVEETKPIDPNTINKPTGVTNDDLVWESNNPSVATVDQNGVVTGVSPGKTVVTVKTKDGKIIDQVTVVVNPKSTPPESIIFEYDYDSANYIDLYNQFPIKDEVGKYLQGDKHTQDFKLRFNQSAVGVRYVITMEKLDGSDLEEDWTKAFLERDGVDVSNCIRPNGRIKTFNEYANYQNNPKEKILYEGVVTSAMATRGYEDYTFRMWISEDVKLYNEDYLSKTFKTRINVYAQE